MSRRRPPPSPDWLPPTAEERRGDDLGKVEAHCGKCGRLLLTCVVAFEDPYSQVVDEQWWHKRDHIAVLRSDSPSGPKLHPQCPCGAKPQVLRRTLTSHAKAGHTRRVDL